MFMVRNSPLSIANGIRSAYPNKDRFANLDPSVSTSNRTTNCEWSVSLYLTVKPEAFEKNYLKSEGLFWKIFVTKLHLLRPFICV